MEHSVALTPAHALSCNGLNQDHPCSSSQAVCKVYEHQSVSPFFFPARVLAHESFKSLNPNHALLLPLVMFIYAWKLGDVKIEPNETNVFQRIAFLPQCKFRQVTPSTSSLKKSGAKEYLPSQRRFSNVRKGLIEHYLLDSQVPGISQLRPSFGCIRLGGL